MIDWSKVTSCVATVEGPQVRYADGTLAGTDGDGTIGQYRAAAAVPFGAAEAISVLREITGFPGEIQTTCYEVILNRQFPLARVKIEAMANEIAAIWRKYYSQNPMCLDYLTNLVPPGEAISGVGQYRPSPRTTPRLSQVRYDPRTYCYHVLIYGIEVAAVRIQAMANELAAVYVKYSNQAWRCA